jgi:hypothetical protein
MVDQVLVAKRDADDPLRHQRLHAVLDEVTVAAVLEAGGETPGQTDDAIGGTQQQRPAVGGDAAAVECGNDRTVFDRCKVEQRWVTLCRHRGTPLLSGKALLQKNFRLFRAPMHLIR